MNPPTKQPHAQARTRSSVSTSVNLSHVVIECNRCGTCICRQVWVSANAGSGSDAARPAAVGCVSGSSVSHGRRTARQCAVSNCVVPILCLAARAVPMQWAKGLSIAIKIGMPLISLENSEREVC